MFGQLDEVESLECPVSGEHHSSSGYVNCLITVVITTYMYVNLSPFSFVSWCSHTSYPTQVFTHYFTWLFKGRLLYNHQTNNFNNIENWQIYINKELKILQWKVKLLVLSNFTFYCNVFKSHVQWQVSNGVCVKWWVNKATDFFST